MRQSPNDLNINLLKLSHNLKINSLAKKNHNYAIRKSDNKEYFGSIVKGSEIFGFFLARAPIVMQSRWNRTKKRKDFHNIVIWTDLLFVQKNLAFWSEHNAKNMIKLEHDLKGKCKALLGR